MRKTRSIQRQRLRSNAAKRLMMFKKNSEENTPASREFVRAELVEQWQVAC